MKFNDEKQVYVIIQAGGRGSRLRHHTWNKPKCLVSVRGKPILYHLFDFFKNAKFIIIADYAFEQLEKYLEIIPPQVNFELIKTTEKGTASGISEALCKVPDNSPIILTWSDLIIKNLPEFTIKEDKPVICTTSAFTCRWVINEEGKLQESPSSTNGIPGIFYFPSKNTTPPLPNKGEFVKWFAGNVKNYSLLDCPDLEELGEFSTIETDNDRTGFCRFFNEVTIKEETVTKRVLIKDYESVHLNEIKWYEDAKKLGFKRIPKILSTSPLTMERIQGRHAYQMSDLTEREKRAVLADYLDTLTYLHDSKKVQASIQDTKDVYIRKTIDRVDSIKKVIPNFNKESITINGKKCRNFFHSRHENIFEKLTELLTPDFFTPIHGDPTFSNTLVDENLRVWFIDPRGYFFKPGIMGDRWYDFAKVYYSAVGSYDQFNRKKFKLHIDAETVEVLMEESLFQKTAEKIFFEYFPRELRRIEVLHGLIWLSLAGYSRDDLDSIVGAFYLGLFWLENGLN